MFSGLQPVGTTIRPHFLGDDVDYARRETSNLVNATRLESREEFQYIEVTCLIQLLVIISHANKRFLIPISVKLFRIFIQEL